jgi:hypothetical protein
MFCPQCKTEYRSGFKTCSDCQVPLVLSLPADNQAGPRGLATSLWEGGDLAFYSALLENLKAADIRYVTEPLSTSPGMQRGALYPLMPMTQFGYQVAVFESDLEPAREVLESLLDQEPAGPELPESAGDESVLDGETSPQQQAFSDEGPTLEIWSGRDDELSGFVRDALRENEIALRAESLGSEKKIYVRPSEAPRAKEIVREVTEARPPQ